MTTHGQRTRPWVSTGAGRGGVGQLPAASGGVDGAGPGAKAAELTLDDPAQQVIAATCSSQAVKGGDEGTSTSTLMKGGGSTFAACRVATLGAVESTGNTSCVLSRTGYGPSTSSDP